MFVAMAREKPGGGWVPPSPTAEIGLMSNRVKISFGENLIVSINFRQLWNLLLYRLYFIPTIYTKSCSTVSSEPK